MKFKNHASDGADLELNLIPLIDILLVILIFLMVTTTYDRFANIEVTLPSANIESNNEEPQEVEVIISASGDIYVNRHRVEADVRLLSEAMSEASARLTEPVVMINADALSAHQHVIDVMQAAQIAGLSNIGFATKEK